jgi:uncharacterized protein (DUF302 family)
MQEPFEMTRETSKNFHDAVAAVEQAAAKKGFRVLHTHDVAATLAERGFQQEPLKIIEICNARYAHEVLQRDIRVALMLPCPISVYRKEGKTFISALLPKIIASFFTDAKLGAIAGEVEKFVREIVEEAK